MIQSRSELYSKQSSGGEVRFREVSRSRCAGEVSIQSELSGEEVGSSERTVKSSDSSGSELSEEQ